MIRYKYRGLRSGPAQGYGYGSNDPRHTGVCEADQVRQDQSAGEAFELSLYSRLKAKGFSVSCSREGYCTWPDEEPVITGTPGYDKDDGMCGVYGPDGTFLGTAADLDEVVSLITEKVTP